MEDKVADSENVWAVTLLVMIQESLEFQKLNMTVGENLFLYQTCTRNLCSKAQQVWNICNFINFPVE